MDEQPEGGLTFLEEPPIAGTPLTARESYFARGVYEDFTGFVGRDRAGGRACSLDAPPVRSSTTPITRASRSSRSTWAHFDGWTAVSKDQLVVWTGFNKAYLLNVTGYCPDLQFANAIAVTSTGSTVDRFEKVIVGPRSLSHQRNPSARHEAAEGRSQAAARADEEARERRPPRSEQPEAKQSS